MAVVSSKQLRRHGVQLVSVVANPPYQFTCLLQADAVLPSEKTGVVGLGHKLCAMLIPYGSFLSIAPARAALRGAMEGEDIGV